MDKCFICDEMKNLWYCYPIPGSAVEGAKLCIEHRKMMTERPAEFLRLYSDKLDIGNKKGRKNV